MGQSPSRSTVSPTDATTSPIPHIRERRRSFIHMPKSVKRLKRVTRPSTWYSNRLSKPSSSPRISTGSRSDATVSSAPSTPMIRTPSPQASPAPPSSSTGGGAKPPVVELTTPTSINETRIQGTQPEARPSDVLSADRSLSRRPSRLDSGNNATTIPVPETLNETHSSSSSSPPLSLPTQQQPVTQHELDTPSPSTSSPISASPNSSPIRTPSNPQANPAPRQFPPPGTLVLVQGVVQTTDVPRPSSVPTESAQSPVTRPRANSDSNSVPSNRPSPPITPRPLSTIPATSPAEISDTPENSSAGLANEQGPAAPAVESHESGTALAPQPTTQISPNSVEVLGTLLSVAAAATAASLLAGSTENIFSPPRTDAQAPRTADAGDFSIAARRERMRHAWQSVRERLGLRPSPTPVPGDGQPVDAREIMLAEMARAFNLGLGIGPDGGEEQSPSVGIAAGSTAPQPTSVSVPPPPSQPTQGEPGSFERFLTDLQYDLRGVLNEERPSAEQPSAERNSDTSSESVPVEPAGSVATPSEASPQPVVEETSNNASEVSPTNDEESRARNVNWWRMYRFPAINAQTNPSTSATPAAPGATATPAPAPEASSIRTPVASDSPHASPIPPNIVHPIVVVGLRSVNAPGHAPTGAPSPAPAPEAGRSPWRNRASDSIRNLRPGSGRRSEEREEANGAPRTFLIFVIGGYYPPDHSMVTGGENGLASFEALLELAEMLGQAKPQTASKDDIERSGLEIIKAADLPRYEAEKRISSNCTDRCLICLDDYAEDDPIRLLKCRHGFHKTCVDRWLEHGKNNCPACRSAGVNTDVPSSSSAF